MRGDVGSDHKDAWAAVVSTRRKSFHAIAEFRLLYPRKSHAASFTAVKNTVNRQDL